MSFFDPTKIFKFNGKVNHVNNMVYVNFFNEETGYRRVLEINQSCSHHRKVYNELKILDGEMVTIYLTFWTDRVKFTPRNANVKDTTITNICKYALSPSELNILPN